MNGNITKLTELKRLRFGQKAQYTIRIEQQDGSLNGSTAELNYNFQSDSNVIATPPQALSSTNMQVLTFELDIPQTEQPVNAINIELKLTILGQVNRVSLEAHTAIFHTDSFNVLMFADFLRAPVYYAIAQDLMEQNCNVTLIVGDESTYEQFYDPQKGTPSVVIGTPQLASSFREIDLFFSDDMNIKFGPKGATRVCMPHSLAENPEMPLTKLGLPLQHSFLTSDYFFMVTPEQEAFQETIPSLNACYPLELTQLRDDKIRLVPVGYPKIALLRQQLSGYKNNTALLFAPSTRALSGISIERTKEICLQLLQSYPDREVIYRPYPSNNEGQGIEQMLQELSQYSNFTFDFSKSSLPALQKARYVFTDASSLAISFSIATKIPHFRISISDISDLPASVDEAGWIEINDIRQLKECIQDLERQAPLWSEKMEAYENKHAYDIDKVFENITLAIVQILRTGGTEKDIKVARTFRDLSGLTEDELVEFVSHRPFMWAAWQIRPLMQSYLQSRFGTDANRVVNKINASGVNARLPNEKSSLAELERMLQVNADK